MLLSDLEFIDNSFALDIDKNFALVPQEIISGERLHTLLTSMFLHAGILHIFGNMLYLFVFGDNVEDAFGHTSYLLFYIISGFASSFVYILTITDQQLFLIPLVGASGAISSVLGAYLVLYPKARILTLIFYGLPIILPIPAILFLGIWFVMQWFSGLYDITVLEGTTGVAYWAHIGGFIVGLIFALLFRLIKKPQEPSF